MQRRSHAGGPQDATALAFETGVPNVIDPLGGSYYVEALTSQLEDEAEALFASVEEVGGVVRGLETRMASTAGLLNPLRGNMGDRAAPPRLSA